MICVEQHAAVMAELESYGRQAQPGVHRAASEFDNAVGDPDFAPSADGAKQADQNGQESRSEGLSTSLA